jgi:hypothetical protein
MFVKRLVDTDENNLHETFYIFSSPVILVLIKHETTNSSEHNIITY